MVTLSRVTIDGNLGFPYVVTLDRVTIYREILLFFFFSTANLSKLGPLRPIPSGKTSVPFVEPSELTTMGFFKLVGLPSVVSWRRCLDYLGSLLSELLCLGE
jgi:hypothetical protein